MNERFCHGLNSGSKTKPSLSQERRQLLFIVILQYFAAAYYLPAMPHALGSSGAQVGMGRALVLAMVALTVVVAFELEADEIWVEAAAPVTARTTMKARTMFFMR